MSTTINQFQGDYRFLSNFYKCDVVYEGVEYKSAEHAFQASKTTSLQWRDDIASMRTPGLAKRIGRQCPIRRNWEVIRVKIMEEVVWCKFYQNGVLGKKLVDTYPVKLVEGNVWHDTFWGVDLETGVGENTLGKILMKVRRKLRRWVGRGGIHGILR